MSTVQDKGIYGNLRVKVVENKQALGEAAADYVSRIIADTLSHKPTARVIFATGASQFEFLQALVQRFVAWDRVTAFHLDEYVGLDENHPASFRRYLRERLFEIVKPAEVHYLDGMADNLDAECERYSRLLLQEDIDLACIGIGENGHIAFNDPPVADFNDPKWVKVVELDAACRQQQYGEGWFSTLDAVPKYALSQTVPSIMRAKAISCVVPDDRKAEAVSHALKGPVATACPASILRGHDNAVLWLDPPASSGI